MCTNDLKRILKIGQFIEDVYAKCPYQRLCTRYIDITEKIAEITAAYSTILGLAIIVWPIACYAITGAMMPILPLYLPDRTFEIIDNFVLIFFVHPLILSAGICFIYVFDTLIFIIFVNLLMVASVIVADIKELDGVLKQPNNTAKESKWRMLKIVLMHKRYSG